ncbi:MAG: SDR family NAD(P)-dependent oxidoreductase [Phycisphaerae bacterium]|nr:SDR family NAD(P)-dependent oxidoreductase [Phycisphaerae bacterium]MBT6283289.1 SDR family NAD(P)-dependent oxidoreductase [Phycisphaerae bacterium]
MKVSLEGKSILITGASSGIGAATAHACVNAGMKCIISARREDRLKNLATDLGEMCTYIVGDVTEQGFNQHLLEETGDVYALFANAGHGLDQKMLDYKPDQVKHLFELNLFSAIELASLAANQMVKIKSGHIIFCTSCLSKFATPSHGAYSASKSALEAIAKSFRMEVKGDGIYVSTVHPIGTKTEFFDESAQRSGKKTSDFATQTPSWLMQSPDKVANAVVRCLQKPKTEVWTSVTMRLLSTSFGAFPRIANRILSRVS